jgi:hypothetical protein
MSLLLVEAFAWLWIGLGVLTGAILGAFFTPESFFGGYSSWPRRMLRLGHIAFFGTGLLCIALSSTLARHPARELWLALITVSMLIGAIGMPLTCALSAFKPRLVPLFILPVLAIGTSVTLTYIHLFTLAAAPITPFAQGARP